MPRYLYAKELYLVEPQGFEPRSRPYEWNELAAVSYPCQDHFLRVLPLHQGSGNFGTFRRIRTPNHLLLRQAALPISVRRHYMVQPAGIEPASTVLQTAAMTTSAKVALNCFGTPDRIRTGT